MAGLLQFAAILTVATMAVGHGHGPAEESMGMENSRMARGGWGSPQAREGPQGESFGPKGRGAGPQGWNSPDDQGGQRGPNSRQRGADSRYRANIFNDEDVYGYEAKYPNGEALYVNYRNTEARSRRGPDFARSNSISARMNSGRSNNQRDHEGQQGHQQRGGNPDAMQQHQPMW